MGYVTLDFREDLMPPKDPVPEFVPLDEDAAAYLRSRVRAVARPSYDNPISLDDYPLSDDWAF